MQTMMLASSASSSRLDMRFALVPFSCSVLGIKACPLSGRIYHVLKSTGRASYYAATIRFEHGVGYEKSPFFSTSLARHFPFSFPAAAGTLHKHPAVMLTDYVRLLDVPGMPTCFALHYILHAFPGNCPWQYHSRGLPLGLACPAWSAYREQRNFALT
jgi:hypothetical protein